jgi:hypothetical protein
MAGKTAPVQDSSLIPPDPSLWQKYSPHHEAPLAGATSIFLHGIVLGILVVGGMAYFWQARADALKPAKMDVVVIEGDGGGLEGLGGAPGLPGAPDAGGPKRTEQVGPIEKVDPIDRTNPRPPVEKPPELGLPTFEDGKTPIDPELRLELERLAKEAKDAADQANKEPPMPKAPIVPGADLKKVGIKGTGNPKGVGGLGGSGGGPGKGNKSGPGTGPGGFGGPVTQQQIFRMRWRFSATRDAKETLRQASALGVRAGFYGRDGKQNLFFYVDDLNRRPAELQAAQPPKLGHTVFFTQMDPVLLGGLSRELGMSFTPYAYIIIFPPDREKEIAAAEEQAAKAMRRNLQTVRATHFEFRLRNGVYEPVVVRFE